VNVLDYTCWIELPENAGLVNLSCRAFCDLETVFRTYLAIQDFRDDLDHNDIVQRALNSLASNHMSSTAHFPALTPSWQVFMVINYC